MARKKKHEEHEEHTDESWLVPYADILTLLLALFIVLFAVSQTDQKKVTEMAQAFSAAFNTGGPSMFDKAGPAATAAADIPLDDNENLAYIKENQQLSETKKQVDEMIKEGGMGDELNTVLTEDGLSIRIKEKALFPSGSAELLDRSKEVAKPISEILAKIPQRVIVSGHTDNLPISNSVYASNWDLSVERSLNFMKFILSQAKLDPARFTTVGHGEYRPIAPNDTEANRAQNRRVEILIMRTTHQPAGMKTIR